MQLQRSIRSRGVPFDQQFKKQHTLDPLPRKGRLAFLSPRTRKYLFRLICRNPHTATKAIPFELQHTNSRTTIWRALSGHNIRKWHTKSKTRLTKNDAKSRYQSAVSQLRDWEGNHRQRLQMVN